MTFVNLIRLYYNLDESSYKIVWFISKAIAMVFGLVSKLTPDINMTLAGGLKYCFNQLNIKSIDIRVVSSACVSIAGERGAGAHAGGDAVAALRRVRAQPGAGRRRDLARQADAVAAHVRLVPAVPRDLARRRRVARLIQGAVAGAPRRLLAAHTAMAPLHTLHNVMILLSSRTLRGWAGATPETARVTYCKSSEIELSSYY